MQVSRAVHNHWHNKIYFSSNYDIDDANWSTQIHNDTGYQKVSYSEQADRLAKPVVETL
jgi:hypothetical protein